MAKKVNLTEDTADGLENTRIPAGWYLTKCMSLHLHPDTENYVYTFKILTGPFAGKTIEQLLHDPDLSDSPETAKWQWKKLKVWWKRMGVIRDEDIGKQVVIEERKPIGSDFVLNVVDDFFTNQKGNRVNIPKSDYAGIYAPDHPEIPPRERVKMGLKLLEGQSLDEPAQPDRKKGGKKTAAETSQQQEGGAKPRENLGFDPADI
jgi:hypothetical protein